MYIYIAVILTVLLLLLEEGGEWLSKLSELRQGVAVGMTQLLN